VRPRGYVIAATGLAAEARLAARSAHVTAVAGGGDETRLKSLLERSVDEGARGIISFGIAGGLKPDLVSGTCVVGTMVICGDGHSHPTDTTWTRHLSDHLPGAELGPIAGCRTAIAAPNAKRTLFEATGAIAVDMESHVVARIAGERKLPFAVLRVIADTSVQRLPPAAIVGLKPDGTPDIIAVLRSLKAEPSQLRDLIHVAVGTRRAMTGLFRCHSLLGPGVGFADLG
jgi:adenosylhomocysteine nucleosidase